MATTLNDKVEALAAARKPRAKPLGHYWHATRGPLMIAMKDGYGWIVRVAPLSV